MASSDAQTPQRRSGDGPVHVPRIEGVAPTQPDIAARLNTVLEGDHGEVRDVVRKLLAEPGFEPVTELSKEEHRERIKDQLLRIAELDFVGAGFPRSVGGEGDTESFVTAFEMLSYGGETFLSEELAINLLQVSNIHKRR